MKYLLTQQETKRLTFRKLQDSDFEDWLPLFEDEKTRQLLGMENYKTAQECCEKWFEWTYHRYENNLGGQNVLISKEHNTMVGQAGLLVREINGLFELEVAYSILPAYRNKGFAIEAAKKCRDFAFENNFHNRLVSIIVPENDNSKKVALKNGMHFSEKINYGDNDMEVFEILKNQWNLL